MLGPALLLVIAAPSLAEPAPCWNQDDPQRPFFTCFDPWRGVEVFAGGRARSGRLDFTVSAAWRLRKERESVSKTDSVWLGVQRIGAVEWAPLAQRLDATAWEIVYRRHATETGITLPGFPDVRLPFPFDVGFGGTIAHFELNARASERWSLETIAATLLFDPLRAPSGQFHLGLGPVAAHRLIATTDGALVHHLSPFTNGRLFLNLESDGGLVFFRGSIVGGAVLQIEGAQTAWRPQVLGSGELGLVPFALNDQPIVVSLRGDGAWRGGSSLEWSASANLGFRFGSKHANDGLFAR